MANKNKNLKKQDSEEMNEFEAGDVKVGPPIGEEAESESAVTNPPVAEVEAKEEPTPEEKNALAQHEEKEADAKEPSKNEMAHKHLDALSVFCHKKSEEKLLNDHGIKRVHTGLILQLADQKAKNSSVHFSDGHREMLKLNYDRLVKAGKIKL